MRSEGIGNINIMLELTNSSNVSIRLTCVLRPNLAVYSLENRFFTNNIPINQNEINNND